MEFAGMVFGILFTLHLDLSYLQSPGLNYGRY